MAGTGAIFRSTLVTDTEVSLGTTEKVEFNVGAVPDANSNLVETSGELKEDISIHSTPKKHLARIQANKLGTNMITVTGYFTDPDGSLGFANFINWMTTDKTNANLPRGRFGIRLDDLTNRNLTPSATVAYILHRFFWRRPTDSPEEIQFIAELYQNGTPV